MVSFDKDGKEMETLGNTRFNLWTATEKRKNNVNERKEKLHKVQFSESERELQSVKLDYEEKLWQTHRAYSPSWCRCHFCRHLISRAAIEKERMVSKVKWSKLKEDGNSHIHKRTENDLTKLIHYSHRLPEYLQMEKSWSREPNEPAPRSDT